MGKCKKKKKKFHRWYKAIKKDLIPVLGFVTVVFELINAIVECVNHWGALAIVIALFLIYLYEEYMYHEDIEEDKQECEQRKKELREKLIKSEAEDERKNISDQEATLEDKHERKQKFIKKSRRRIRIAFWIAAAISVSIFVYGLAVGKGKQGTEGVARNESGARENKENKELLEKVTGENGETTDDTDQNGAESKGEIPDIHFILDEPGRLKTLTDEMIKDVFYVSNVSPEKNGEEVSGHIDGIFGEKREDTSGNASIIEQGVIDEASKQEAIFKNDMQRAAECKSRNDEGGWQDYIPHSNDLENKIMNEREQFWNLEEPIFGSTLAFMMANSNQLLADEYKLQGGRPETVIFYWVESITWTERGLSYGNLFQEDKDEYYPYLKARYKDIYDFIEAHEDEPWAQEETYQEIKEKAYAIYLEM